MTRIHERSSIASPARAGMAPREEDGSFLKRMVLTIVLAVVLASVELEGGRGYSEPDAIVMLSSADHPVRFPRVRPYRAHYRRP